MPEQLSREELLALLAVRDRQIAELTEANQALAAKLARLEHLLSRNSRNSSIVIRESIPGIHCRSR